MTPATTMTRQHSRVPTELPPPRSLEQRLNALDRANSIRIARSQLKRDLKAGRASIPTLLIDPPAWLDTMKVFDLVLAQPKYGKVKVNKVLGQCRVSPAKTVGGLSSRQRAEIASLLRRTTGA